MSSPATVRARLAAALDHTLLRPEATQAEIVAHCARALELGVAAVCVQPRWLPECVGSLRGSSIAPCTVIAFPHGALPSELKAAEARWAVEQGALELDMVADLAALCAGDFARAQADIAAVVRAAAGRCVKVILETALLDATQKRGACAAAVAAGAQFVKTSTGFAKGGATLEDVRLLRASVPATIGVKASGGIRTRAEALAMLEAGANRIGTSNSEAILA